MNRIEVNANESGRDVYIYIFTSCPSLVASSQAHSKTARTRYDERQEWQADSAAAAADAARGVTGCCRESVTADGDLPRISDTFSSVRPSATVPVWGGQHRPVQVPELIDYAHRSRDERRNAPAAAIHALAWVYRQM